MVELEGTFGNKLHCNLHRGDSGAFEVRVDGELIFSKLATGRFPAKGAIVKVVKGKLGRK